MGSVTATTTGRVIALMWILLLASRLLVKRNVGCAAYNYTVCSAKGDQHIPCNWFKGEQVVVRWKVQVVQNRWIIQVCFHIGPWSYGKLLTPEIINIWPRLPWTALLSRARAAPGAAFQSMTRQETIRVELGFGSGFGQTQGDSPLFL